MERRLRFAGYVLRMDKKRIPYTAIKWIPKKGKRKQGRPRKTWRATFKEDLENMNVTWDSVEINAADRIRWRELVARCTKQCWRT